MLKRFREGLDLTGLEFQRLNELSEIASGKISIPLHASEEEVAIFRLLAKCTGRMPPGHLRTIKQFLESWLQMTGFDNAARAEAAPEEEEKQDM